MAGAADASGSESAVLPWPDGEPALQDRASPRSLMKSLCSRASKERDRLQAASPSERLRAVLKRAQAATAAEPGPRVLLREELRRAEAEMLALKEAIEAAHGLLQIRADVAEDADEPSSGSNASPSLHELEVEVAAPLVADSSSTELATESSPGAASVQKTVLDRQVDAWLQQERVKNSVQPHLQAPSSNGRASLLLCESMARMELESQASSDTHAPNLLHGYRSPEGRTGESLLFHQSKPSVLPEEKKSSPPLPKSESVLLRESRSLQARRSSLCNVQRLVLEAERANGIHELCDVRGELAVAIEASKRHGVAECDLAYAEASRRRVHNAAEDLKGNLRVYCCVRPMNSREGESGDTLAVTSVDNMTVQVQNLWERAVFNFDAVFLPSRQEDVFKECRDLAQSALDGHNVAIFAYGQTSAGKTHTIFGEPGKPGLAPRMIQEIYTLVRRKSGRFAHTITGSMLELYRNDLVDLLSKDAPLSDVTKKLRIQADKHGAVQIEHLTEEACQSAAELVELLERGHRHRTTRATAMNAQSSRSHVVFVMKIGQVNLETGEELRGKITVCDLAGSERLKRAMVSGEGAKEAIEINRSLTALSDVMTALRQGQKQIPYRNHKLTQLMQDSLSQASKVLMFVNCSPASSNVDESMMSLKYATRAKKIKTASAAKGRRTSEPAITPQLRHHASEPVFAPQKDIT